MREMNWTFLTASALAIAAEITESGEDDDRRDRLRKSVERAS